MNHHKQGACSKKPAVSPAQPVHAKTCRSSGKAAGDLADGAYTWYVRTTKARERRWRTLRLREVMLFQQAPTASPRASRI